MSKIEMNKQYRYRNGEPARVLCVDRPNTEWPVLALMPDGTITTHTNTGAFSMHLEIRDKDLIEVKQPDYRWFNVYRSYTVLIRCHESKELADYEATADRIACIKIDLNEIEGRFDE